MFKKWYSNNKKPLITHSQTMKTLKKETLLSFIAPFLPDSPVIMEAGAFNGKDSLWMNAFWPQANIHAFEPLPDAYANLKKNIGNKSNISAYPLALSYQTGTATFHVSEKPTKPGLPFQAGSLLKPKERLSRSPIQYPKTIEVPTQTIQNWAQQNNINQVDFFWLDVQGMALPILKAAGPLLHSMKALWIEVEFIEAYEKQATHHELIAWLESQGFKAIAQDFENEKDWFFGNILFVNSKPSI